MLFEFNPDVLDAAYISETKHMNPEELIRHSRKWHEGIMRLLALEAQNPSLPSMQRLDALRQIYMFYLIRHSFS